MKHATWSSFALGGLALLASACSSQAKESTNPPPPTVEVTPPPYGKPWDTLSQWNLFVDDDGETPADGVMPYEVNAPLFTDYTTKFRFLYLPKGKKIHYDADAAWDLPVGAALVKTFAMPADVRHPDEDLRKLETRILFHEPDGWSVNTYVWSDDQKDAKREIVGPILHLTFKGEHGETVHDAYAVPNQNDCVKCHGFKEATPLGPKTRQLNRDHDFGGSVGVKNQIDQYDALGWFDGPLPAAASRAALVDPYGDGDLHERVRAYWDSNCGHCHTTGGYSGHSGLLLDYLSTDPKMNDANWGVCKSPTEAGGDTCGDTYDVVPGDPDHSIMVCRVSSTKEGTMMPPVGVQLLNAEGIDVVRQWIASLPKTGCP
ncbi:MAG TPA: hypothetical protein VHB21_03400 [Minicystis sp.]|nr:hypothetical protein [Minicystis sp.]